MRKFVVVIVATLFFPSGVFALSPTITGTANSGGFLASTTPTLLVDTSGAGQNKALIVITGQSGSGNDSTSATCNGTAMTKIINLSAAQQVRGIMYYLAAPPQGTEGKCAVQVTWAGSVESFIIGATYQDMGQSSASVVDASGQANSGSATALAKSITTLTDSDIVINWGGWGLAALSITNNSPQVTISAQVDNVSMRAKASDTPAATAGAISTGYTWTNNANLDEFAVALKYQAPSATTVPTFGYYSVMWW